MMKCDKPIGPHPFVEKFSSLENIDGKFYIGEMTAGTSLADFPYKTDYYVCCICSAGESRGRIDLIPYSLKGLGMSINIPGQLLEHEYTSEDFLGLYILMSKEFVGSLGLPYNFQVYMSVTENPVIALTRRQYDALLSYGNMVRSVIGINHPSKLEIVRHLTCAFFYGMGYYFHQISENRQLSNEEALMQNFLKAVQTHYKTERKVLFYAEKLHLSAGYLSTLIKKASGKTAAELIDDFVVLEAKYLLKSTRLTVQQISDSLNFPTQSFFGKYFKRQTGVSPRQYRKE